MKSKLYSYFLYAWYRYPWAFIGLLPFTFIYRVIIFLRRLAYQYHFFQTYRAPCPVIVVGNLLIGGSGKTPMVIWLSQVLKEAGFKPGIITRGYGGDNGVQNIIVTATSEPALVGDEPVMMAQQTDAVIIKNKNRKQAARELASRCDVIISDDGLQHYALKRDVEIILLGQTHWVKNLFCLPAGPWRESPVRIKDADFIIGSEGAHECSHYQQKVILKNICALNDAAQTLAGSSFQHKKIHAACGIAMPWRFFEFLRKQGFEVVEHVYPDHYTFKQGDLEFSDNFPVFITEKDAIKCRSFSLPNVWVVNIAIEVSAGFKQAILEKLAQKKGEK